jgi:putative phage-type endonuclease
MVQAIALDPSAPPPFAATCIATGIHSTDRDTWLRARRRGLAGSDVAAVLNLHPYKSAIEVYADKVVGSPANDTAGEVALWGQLFEQPILAEFARRTGRAIAPCGELMQSRQRAWWLATPDGVQLDGAPPWAVGPGLCEVKMTSLDWLEEIPAYVHVQVQHQMLVTGALWNSIVWLPVPDRRLQWIDVGPHREFQAMLGEKCDEFWLRVLERRPPDPDGSESARRALTALHPHLDDEVVELDAGAEDIADEVENISAAIRDLEARKSLIYNRVLHVLGEQKVGLLDSGRYFNSWAVAERDVKCTSCDAVHGVVRGFRACRLMPARKKPHALPLEMRELSIKPSAEIARLLEASIELLRRGAA